jgi:hypothetical protein
MFSEKFEGACPFGFEHVLATFWLSHTPQSIQKPQ